MLRLLVTVAVAVLPVSGTACTLLAPFDMGQIGGAELVVVGEVTDYAMVEGTWNAALVTVQIDETLKGRATGEVTFVWNGGMAQGPHEARAKGRVLIGAMEGGRIALSTLVPDERPDLPSIIQPYCGEVWMQPASPAVVKAARKALE
ncbi:MAG: hypothetical protein MUE52_11955 [Tabrizicola sp.]|jgi:hypothetical protein|nr:hypothetical protein [Tabrizicola sp.]